MLRYALRRLSYLPLSLLLLSLVCFALRSSTPGDPVEELLSAADVRLAEQNPAAYDRTYHYVAARRGYDRPAFYCTISNAALPDTLHRVVRSGERKMLRALTLATGNWPAVQAYYRELKTLAYHSSTASEPAGDLRPAARRLLIQDDPVRIRAAVAGLAQTPDTKRLRERLGEVFAAGHRSRLLLPALRWNGTDCRYHRWITGILAGDFGNSYIDRRPVLAKLRAPLRRTMLLNGLAIVVVLVVSIPLGLYAAGYRGGRFDRWSGTLLFVLHGLPSFWVATLLANFFTTPAFGMDFFPAMGFGEVAPDAGWWASLRTQAAHLLLPVACLAYPSWAYVSRQLRRSAAAEMDKAYVTTARLKGLTTGRILWGHVLRNASFPIITLLGGVFPAMLAGSVLIERIFNLPGMGQLLYTAAIGQDWPVVIAIVLLSGVLTAVGLLLADLTYAFTDPRVCLVAEPTVPITVV